MATCDNVSCRKRARSDPDDCEECVPISKRINNLHIRHSTEGWDEREYSLGEGFNNNMPGQSACCQRMNQSSVRQGATQPTFAGESATGCSHRGSSHNVHIQGLPFDVRAPETTSPDINHNNPLLSPLPSLPRGIHAQGNSQFPQPGHPHFPQGEYPPCDYIPELNASENPYYFQINGELFKAHLDRAQRLQCKSPEFGFPGV